MRKNFGAKPFLYPQPVMIIGTYDEEGRANAMNAAWGGIVGMNEIIVDLSNHRCSAYGRLRLCGGCFCK